MEQEQTKVKDMRKTFFSQLRRFCRNMEDGIDELSKNQVEESKRVLSSEDSMDATNLILHTTKELKDLKYQAHAQYDDFVEHNSRMSHIQDLMKGLLQNYAQRLENVESFIERYGYARPASTWQDNAASSRVLPEHVIGNEEKLNQEVSSSETESGEVGSDVNGEEETNVNGEAVTPARPVYSALRTPEPPKLLALNSKFSSRKGEGFESKVYATEGQGYQNGVTPANNEASDLGKPSYLLSHETPEHIKEITRSIKKAKADVIKTTPVQPQLDNNVNQEMFVKNLPALTPLKTRQDQSTPQTPDSIKRIFTTMRKTGPAHDKNFPEQSHILGQQEGGNYFAPAKSHHLSTPEPSPAVTSILNSIKKSQPLPSSASCDLAEPNPMNNEPPFKKSFFLSTPETPECVRRILETTRQIENSYSENTQVAPSSAAYVRHSNSCSDGGMPSAGVANLQQQQQKDLLDYSASHPLHVSVSDQDGESISFQHKDKGTYHFKCAKSLFSSPGPAFMTKTSSKSASIKDTPGNVYEQLKENTDPVQRNKTSLNVHNKIEHTAQFSLLKTPEPPTLLTRPSKW
ncbi:hypothetical protein PoB_000001100 [Plakobranchus ocellatus]|uniref:Spindle and kinetochore-associated protein 3 n=1 Tax=Plakobranchus ocellatus TaxID=259542 RepID=A0AAV3WR13_9GAST|nr:hypothetical protein PoB_000001100 [Plakobranchus ocellatus]